MTCRNQSLSWVPASSDRIGKMRGLARCENCTQDNDSDDFLDFSDRVDDNTCRESVDRCQMRGEDNVKRLILCGLLGGLLATNTGCGLFRAVFCYRRCVSRDCGPGMVDGACDEGGCGSCGRWGCAGGCDVGCDPCSDPCGSGCYGRPWHRGPLSCVFALLNPDTWCGGGCGERYWGDFYNDPPDCVDPCDGYGNYSGGGCRSCAGNSGRYSAGSSGGCRNCGGNSDAVETYDDGSVSRNTSAAASKTVSRTNRTGTTSRVASQPHRAVRP